MLRVACVPARGQCPNDETSRQLNDGLGRQAGEQERPHRAAKEQLGQATDHDQLSEKATDQTKANLKQTGEKVKGAGKG